MIRNSNQEDIKPESSILNDGSQGIYTLPIIYMPFIQKMATSPPRAFPKDSRQPTFELEAAPPRPGLVAPMWCLFGLGTQKKTLKKYDKVQIYKKKNISIYDKYTCKVLSTPYVHQYTLYIVMHMVHTPNQCGILGFCFEVRHQQLYVFCQLWGWLKIREPPTGVGSSK